jgi:hypothetical protein
MTILRALGALGALLLVVDCRPAAAADTLTGEVVDVSCYMGHPDHEKMRGPGHRKCADTCLKKGLPMGILTEDKQVFIVLEDHDNPKAYADLKGKAAETVTVEGNKVSVGGSQGIVVQAIK